MSNTKYFSISDLRKHTASVCKDIIKNKKEAIILNHNRPEVVLISFEEYQKLINQQNEDIEDLQDLLVAKAEASGSNESLTKFKKRFKHWEQ